MSVVLTEVDDGMAVVTLNRPEVRNALNGELLRAIRTTMANLEADQAVHVVIITGADPAFCAGVDLKEIAGGPGGSLVGTSGEAGVRGPWAPMTKPVIGAVNGPAVTGGFEIALQCDFLIASERAAFGDTHARVGLVPGWGLSVLLPQAVGVRKAKEMSLTGNFLLAPEALAFGLVNRVVAHDDLLPTAKRVAADIAGNDQRAVTAILQEYKDVTSTTVTDGLRLESELARKWNSDGAAVADVERRRAAILERGRSQTART